MSAFPRSAKASRLKAELRRDLSGEVRFDDTSRALYAASGSNYRRIPIGLVLPKNDHDVLRTIELCNKYSMPVLSRGGGTSLAGQSCNEAVIIDHSKYRHRVLEINQSEMSARVEPGCILDHLRDEASRFGLTFAPDPATHEYCTIGGMIGNNSCGVHSVFGGKTVDNVFELDVVTYNGSRFVVGPTNDALYTKILSEGGERAEIYRRLKQLQERYGQLIRERYPHLPRRVSGYNLDWLLPEHGFDVARALVGSEGTLVTIISAKLRLLRKPPSTVLVVLGFDDIYAAADAVPDAMKFNPIGLEGLDDRLVKDINRRQTHKAGLNLLPRGKGWLLVEMAGGDKIDALSHAEKVLQWSKSVSTCLEGRCLVDDNEQHLMWKIRESGLGATSHVEGKELTWEGWEDSAVPPENFGAYLRDLRKLLEDSGYVGDFYGHFGQGCLHTRINFDFRTAAGIAQYKRFINEAANLVVSYGGSLSGEHGDGQSRAALLPKMFGSDMVQVFEEFKKIWDPHLKMNPTKIVWPHQPTDDLRIGTDYRPLVPKTHFSFLKDKNSFSRTLLRCVGVGKCRRTKGGTMCPSFMATRDEMHTTRGRARLLFELMRGDSLEHSWRNKGVRQALELCLACKGCKGDCPVNVDMATYKAEYLSHYYRLRLRPRAAYSMGLIRWWAIILSKLAWFVNCIGRTPVLGAIVKWLGGISQRRQLPKFSRENFIDWYQKNHKSTGSKKRVLLWPDTFNTHFQVDALKATYWSLTYLGYNVELPRGSFCCGRPLYDFGMLNLAKRYLNKILTQLRDDLSAGTPIIVLEPSCLSVFHDELSSLFPGNEDARRLTKQSYGFADFLLKEDVKLPQKPFDALFHAHCHTKGLKADDAERKVLVKLGASLLEPEEGCCGMAGAFGFDAKHYAISQSIAERALLPQVRALNSNCLIVASGFSCREQIEQSTQRRTKHFSEVVWEHLQ